jgi:serine/threonine protein kinase
MGSNTAGNSGAKLSLQNDGNLVVYSVSGATLWVSNVLHWCLTGRPPYRDDEIVWLSRAYLRAEPPPLTIDGLLEGIDELYLACLSKDPDERPTAEGAAVMLVLAPYALAPSARSGPDPDRARSRDVAG